MEEQSEDSDYIAVSLRPAENGFVHATTHCRDFRGADAPFDGKPKGGGLTVSRCA
jgi:hypothetical protein